jgi:hypothetical protein
VGLSAYIPYCDKGKRKKGGNCFSCEQEWAMPRTPAHVVILCSDFLFSRCGLHKANHTEFILR